MKSTSTTFLTLLISFLLVVSVTISLADQEKASRRGGGVFSPGAGFNIPGFGGGRSKHGSGFGGPIGPGGAVLQEKTDVSAQVFHLLRPLGEGVRLRRRRGRLHH
ncbi:hypothetical protein OROGR_003143 [Orobanche gracilis]